jgi:hypothetical protein
MTRSVRQLRYVSCWLVRERLVGAWSRRRTALPCLCRGSAGSPAHVLPIRAMCGGWRAASGPLGAARSRGLRNAQISCVGGLAWWVIGISRRQPPGSRYLATASPARWCKDASPSSAPRAGRARPRAFPQLNAVCKGCNEEQTDSLSSAPILHHRSRVRNERIPGAGGVAWQFIGISRRQPPGFRYLARVSPARWCKDASPSSAVKAGRPTSARSRS